MFNRKTVVVVTCLVLGALLAQRPASASSNTNKTMYLTFSGAVQLPGVTLAAGTYTFELEDPMASGDLVCVRNRRGDHAYFLGFTRRVDRPANLRPGQVVSFSETAAGTPPRIAVWYPSDDSHGREFIYRR